MNTRYFIWCSNNTVMNYTPVKNYFVSFAKGSRPQPLDSVVFSILSYIVVVLNIFCFTNTYSCHGNVIILLNFSHIISQMQNFLSENFLLMNENIHK
jgi:hypothetical protein